MRPVKRLRKSTNQAHTTSALVIGSATLLTSCAQPAPGYREDPGACSVISDPNIVRQLGDEALQFPATADVTHTHTQRSSKCEWTSNHPPGWTPRPTRRSR